MTLTSRISTQEHVVCTMPSIYSGEETPKMQEYTCAVCEYVYDPEKGDPEGGIEPGTPFENIPEDWVCPVCGATKDQFAPA